jgi:hypothetical protein
MQSDANAQSMLKAAEENGGFTVDVTTGAIPSKGYQAAWHQYENTDGYTASPAGLQQFTTDHLTPLSASSHYAGGWLFGGKVFVDVSRNLGNFDDACNFGLQQKQLGIFDNAHFDVIKLPDPNR